MSGALNKISTAVPIALVLLMFLLTGCDRKEEAKRVRLEKKETLQEENIPPEGRPLRIAVGSMITPRAGFAYYRRLLDYIGEKMGRPVKFVGREKYAEVNELLKTGSLDIAFVCSGPYVEGRDEFGLQLLAIPVAYGETVYYSYIIVQKDSPIKTFEGLRGKTFAFADPDSNTGKLVPTYMLARMGETPDSFFREYVYTYAHDKSIKEVANKMVDGAAVDSLVWNYLNKTDPEYTSRTSIILKSPPYGIPPVVVRPGLDAATKTTIREIFLGLHKDEKGKEILKGMMIDRFVEGNNASYKSIGDMMIWTARHKRKSR